MSRFPLGSQPARPFSRGNGPPDSRSCAPSWSEQSPNAPFVDPLSLRPPFARDQNNPAEMQQSLFTPGSSDGSFPGPTGQHARPLPIWDIAVVTGRPPPPGLMPPDVQQRVHIGPGMSMGATEHQPPTSPSVSRDGDIAASISQPVWPFLCEDYDVSTGVFGTGSNMFGPSNIGKGHLSSLPNKTCEKRKPHSQTCPMTDCGHQTRRMKGHVYYHLPRFFHVPKTDDPVQETSKLKVKGLRMIARFLVGKGSTLEDLVDFVNQHYQTEDLNFPEEIRREAEYIISLENWTVVTPSVKPINTPAVLIHWRILAFLFNELTKDQQDQLFDLEDENEAIPAASFSQPVPSLCEDYDASTGEFATGREMCGPSNNPGKRHLSSLPNKTCKKRKPHLQTCPMKDCGHQSKKLKGHVYYHFPRFFCVPKKDDPWPVQETSKLKVKGLRMIARFLVGKGSTLEDLVDYVNQYYQTEDLNFPEEIRREAEYIISLENWTVVTPSVKPINTPAVLIHWRILAFLFNELTKDQQDQLFDLEDENEAIPAASFSQPVPSLCEDYDASTGEFATGREMCGPSNNPGKRHLSSLPNKTCKKRKPHLQTCPMKDCGHQSKKLKGHVYYHFPRFFCVPKKDDPWPVQETSKLKVKGLRMIARFLVGKGSTLEDLVDYVNQYYQTEDLNFPEEIRREAEYIISLENWTVVTPSVKPINTPAVLIQWRILAFLFNELTKDQQDQLFDLEDENEAIPAASFSQPVPSLCEDYDASTGEFATGREMCGPSNNPGKRHLSSLPNKTCKKRKPHLQTCPMKDCDHQTRKLKGHVCYHLPSFFHFLKKDDPWPVQETSKLKVKGLRMIARFVVGKGSTLEDLVDYVNQHYQTEDLNFTEAIRKEMEYIISVENWTVVAPSWKPINTPAVLIHWRILAFLFNKLTKDQQARLFDLEDEIEAIPAQPVMPPMVPLSWLDEPSEPEQSSARPVIGRSNDAYGDLSSEIASGIGRGKTVEKPYPAKTGAGKNHEYNPSRSDHAVKEKRPDPSSVAAKGKQSHKPKLQHFRKREVTGQSQSKSGTWRDSVNQPSQSRQTADAANAGRLVEDRRLDPSHTSGESLSMDSSQIKSMKTCPIIFCHFVTDIGNCKWHVNLHLPTYFRSKKAHELCECSEEQLSERARLQVSGLRLIAQFILGKGATLNNLMDYVNANWQEADINLLLDIQREMDLIISQESWPRVTPSVSPINSPAVLIHWQIVVFLMNQLTPDQWSQLYDLEQKVQNFPVQVITSPPPAVSGFDAHFYPESLSKKVDEDTGSIDLTAGREPDHPVNIIGGVSNYNNPSFFATEQFERMVLSRECSSTWKIAVGINPKQASTVTSAEWSSLVKCLSHPKVVAISDVGFDFRATPDKWRDQEQLFRRILDLGTTGYVLVLYLRGTQDDPAGAVVHKLSRTILGQKCSKHQRIHLHRFAGDAAEVNAWTEMFPNCYFGITGVISLFSAAQIGGVNAIPPDRLLLETNSPHHKLYPEMVVNTSAFLADLGKLVADVRGVSLEFLMEITLANALRLYGA